MMDEPVSDDEKLKYVCEELELHDWQKYTDVPQEMIDATYRWLKQRGR